LSDSLQLLSF